MNNLVFPATRRATGQNTKEKTMCGIIGYCGPKNAVHILLEGLKRLEYRGYDSAGICTCSGNTLTTIKTKGKIKDLQSRIPANSFANFGIGHTRWATHGEVNDINAHPHEDCASKISVVHNGIIENFESLKNMLVQEGHKFKSATDSEVIVHLIEKYYAGDLRRQ